MCLVVEIFSVVPKEAKANANTKLTLQEMQNLVCRSGVLECRGIPHRAPPTKEIFVRRFASVKHKPLPLRHYAHKHKLSDAWTNIMLRRRWPAMDEAAARRSAAAWSWLQASRNDTNI